MKKLYRSNKDRVIAGVCGGLGEYLGIDPVILRIIFVVALFSGGTGFWIYIILWIVIPLEEISEKKEVKPNSKNKDVEDAEIVE
ncbi:PspC domain-containing protein [Candidatus Dojkabacteria bacterium]|uniref:PspC domain-containing protein n=1 Tax=Candidatus Dojkabacteria bacterium TaxID=2099670 RepID=A0A955RM20_9BACT|nr:PspC domain-containing protein [Candidatus Dojkabacteria bacterium]